MSSEGTLEEESLEVALKNRCRGCRHDRLGQTVPSTGSSNREGPITNVYCLAVVQLLYVHHHSYMLLSFQNILRLAGVCSVRQCIYLLTMFMTVHCFYRYVFMKLPPVILHTTCRNLTGELLNYLRYIILHVCFRVVILHVY